MKKDEARSRLLDIFVRISHGPECSEPDAYFEDGPAPHHPDRDGCLTVKCWNCNVAQDHFLYEE